jgi:hypothetical protein
MVETAEFHCRFSIPRHCEPRSGAAIQKAVRVKLKSGLLRYARNDAQCSTITSAVTLLAM